MENENAIGVWICALWWQKCLENFPLFLKCKFEKKKREKEKFINEKKLPNFWNRKIEKKKAIARRDFFFFSKLRKNLESNMYTEVHGLRCQKNLKYLITLLLITKKTPLLSQWWQMQKKKFNFWGGGGGEFWPLLLRIGSKKFCSFCTDSWHHFLNSILKC